MSESQLSDEQARLAKARAFFAAEEKMLKQDAVQAEKIKEEKGTVERNEGESTGEWLARRDED
jgi:hypothetical protein